MIFILSLIVAISKNNAIGKDNKLLFHIKEDLAFFKKTTLNKTIVMGRKTFESLPGVLPSRKHIVITRDENYSIDNENVEIEHDLLSVLNKYKDSEEEVIIIGGGEIYKQALDSNLIDKLYITKVDKVVEDADAFFPKVSNKDYLIEEIIELTDICSVHILKKIIDISS